MSLPAGNYNPATISWRDAGNEIGSFSCYGPLLTAANFDANSDLFDTLVTKAQALVLGSRVKEIYEAEKLIVGTQPTNGAARETKLLIQYRDTTTLERFTATLPTLNPALPLYVVNENAKDVVRLDSPTAVTEFITAFNAFAVNPRTGNAVAIIGLKVVGRNV